MQGVISAVREGEAWLVLHSIRCGVVEGECLSLSPHSTDCATASARVGEEGRGQSAAHSVCGDELRKRVGKC